MSDNEATTNAIEEALLVLGAVLRNLDETIVALVRRCDSFSDRLDEMDDQIRDIDPPDLSELESRMDEAEREISDLNERTAGSDDFDVRISDIENGLRNAAKIIAEAVR